jgi:ornithine decarboxylase
MTRLLSPNSARAGLPASWPTPLHPAELNLIDVPTPFLACDLNAVRAKYRRLVRALPGASVHYAMKCNSTPDLLRALAAVGSGFEVASIGELSVLGDLGIDPVDVLFSNPVKPPAAVAQARAAGLWRFSFDSEGELYKIARQAPGSAVYVRLRVDDSSSVFPLSRKFGAELHQARALLLLARSLGLRPYGVTFHVGSQCTATNTWRQAVA